MTLLKETISTSNGRIPSLINIAEKTTSDAIALAQLAEKNGADGLMLLPPMQYKADEHETTVYFKTVANNTSLPIILYNNPVDYKIAVTIPMLDALSSVENIQAIKESSRDITNVTRQKNAFGDRYKILCGVDTIALECLAAGADGWVAGLVNAFPRETVVIYELVKAGRIEEALKIYRWFMPLLELDIHPKLVQYIKLAEVAAGIGTEPVRPPRLVLGGEERKRITGIIAESLASRPDLSIYDEVGIV
jgi:4-hydroxy-tetrahydrodipicolinate synthase